MNENTTWYYTTEYYDDEYQYDFFIDFKNNESIILKVVTILQVTNMVGAFILLVAGEKINHKNKVSASVLKMSLIFKVLAAILLFCKLALELWRKHVIPKVTNQVTNTEIQTEVRFYQKPTFRMIMLNTIILLNGICGIVSAFYKVWFGIWIFLAWLGLSFIIGVCATCAAFCATHSDLSKKWKFARLNFFYSL